MICEKSLLDEYHVLIGCDEVGRGPLAGPVVGCAVKVTKSECPPFEAFKTLAINDSKKLSALKRRRIIQGLGLSVEKLAVNCKKIVSFEGHEFSFVLCEHSPQEIDEMNILRASLSCMQRAASILYEEGENPYVLVDGNFGFHFENAAAVTPLVKGDTRSLCVALASIIAKEFRDYQMKFWEAKYPGYGFAKHSGYPTQEHRAALLQLGISPVHRKSFKGVKELLGPENKATI